METSLSTGWFLEKPGLTPLAGLSLGCTGTMLIDFKSLINFETFCAGGGVGYKTSKQIEFEVTWIKIADAIGNATKPAPHRRRNPMDMPLIITVLLLLLLLGSGRPLVWRSS